MKKRENKGEIENDSQKYYVLLRIRPGLQSAGSYECRKIMKELGYSGIEVLHSSLSTAANGVADLFVIGKDLEASASELENKIVLDNILDMTELKEKLETKLKQSCN